MLIAFPSIHLKGREVEIMLHNICTIVSRGINNTGTCLDTSSHSEMNLMIMTYVENGLANKTFRASDTLGLKILNF